MRKPKIMMSALFSFSIKYVSKSVFQSSLLFLFESIFMGNLCSFKYSFQDKEICSKEMKHIKLTKTSSPYEKH
eukprot:TRINITY_DN11520_c0_g1_i1.p1 TRINITY_DN11520_c0_g1~~TRINITY_DN11520_c0_g1_i1.p1  ORF type:complete len:73 (+),score=11.32 TRINITY_DN11520_c0_g1_i1:15-233(+)